MRNRRWFAPPLAALAALVLITHAAPARAQERDFSKVEITTTQVAPGVWMLKGAGGNIGVCAGDDGVFLIDDQFAPLTPRIKAAIATISDRPVRFLLNTHHHGDHTGGNENLAGEGVLIVAQDNVRRHMSREEFNELFNRTTPAAPAKALPMVTFSDTVTFHMNGQDVRCFHVAHAHTDGDAVVAFPGLDVIHTGDLLFNGGFPVIDCPAGGSIEGMIAGSEILLAMSDANTKFIPGHGPLATRDDVKAYHDMLVTVRDRVKKLLAQGRSVDEAIAAKPLADLEARWNGAGVKADMLIKEAYATLGRKGAANGKASR